MTSTLDLLTIKEVSELLGFSLRFVYDLIKADGIGYVKIGKSYRVPRAEVDALIARSTRKAKGADND